MNLFIWNRKNKCRFQFRWSPSIPKWTRDVQPMPSKRTGLAAEVLNDKIYILGGKVNEVYTNTMEAYDVDTREWETKASMKETRANFCVSACWLFRPFGRFQIFSYPLQAAAYQGCLYAVAGSKSDQMQVNTVEKYDPSNDSWITIANITATGHVGVSCFVRSLICAGLYLHYNRRIITDNYKSLFCIFQEGKIPKRFCDMTSTTTGGPS